MTPSDSTRRVRYRLRWTAESGERTFLLSGAAITAGSAEGSHLLLTQRGVSRSHARFSATAEGVELEDLGSRNGTFVDGRRVSRARLAPGAEVRLGPVKVVLEAIDPADARLAFAFEVEPPSAPGRPRDDSTPGFSEDRALAHLELIERAFDAGAARGADAALAALAEGLGADGAILLEWRGQREPVVLASRGPTTPLAAWFAQAVRTGPGTGPVHSGFLSGPHTGAFALAASSDSRLAVAVIGPVEGRPDGPALLRLFLRFIALGRGATCEPRPRMAPPRPPVFPDGYLPGESEPMRRLYAELGDLAASRLPVLLEGETGAGKEPIARALHASSPRAGGPFVAVNCAAIPAELLEAEMFGVAEGAATGVRAREGQVRAAERGTLFLDEIGEMPMPLQAKVLRVLHEMEVWPVGGRPVAVDVRVVAATNRDLLRAVEEGRFRADLYYRVAGGVLRVPSLRERSDDVPPLVRHLLARAAREAGRRLAGVTVKAMELLVRYPWPGNVRELEHELRRLAQACPEGHAVESRLLSDRIRDGLVDAGDGPLAAPTLKLGDHVRALERRLIGLALERTGNSQRKAAVILGISRNALARKVRGYRLGN